MRQTFDDFGIQIGEAGEAGSFTGYFDYDPSTGAIEEIVIETWGRREKKWRETVLTRENSLLDYDRFKNELEGHYGREIEDGMREWRADRPNRIADKRHDDWLMSDV